MRNRFSCIGGALLPLLLLIGSMTTTSCVKKLTYVDPNPSEQNPSTPDDGKDEDPDITVDQLKFKTVCLSADANEGIYGDVDFVADATGYNLTATITNYKADLSQLKVTFEAVADQVTANGTTQVSKETVNDFRQPVTFRLHTKDGQFRDFTLAVQNPKESYTGYPVLAIVTDGRAPVVSKEDWVKGRYVLDPQESRIERQAGPLQIKGRGHNSWTQDKKPYNIKLEEKAPMMGMPKHKRWCLLANAGDKSLFRNRVAYRLGQLTGLPWTPKTEFVDVMLNGKFVGNYLLTEQIRVDKNRVNIVEAQAGMKPEEVGYLLEFDRYVEENYFYTDLRQLPVIIKDPDEEMLTAEQKRYIADAVNRVESLLYGGDSVDPAYRDLIDIDTYIDWWMVMELTENRDTRLPGSSYMYMDAGKKLCAGPLWDFDLTTFRGGQHSFIHYDYEVDLTNSAVKDRSLWYKRLFSDPVFKARAKERWREFYAKLPEVYTWIDAEKAAVSVSARTNWEIWPNPEGSVNGDETLAWEDAVDQLKANLQKRATFLNQQIESWE